MLCADKSLEASRKRADDFEVECGITGIQWHTCNVNQCARHLFSTCSISRSSSYPSVRFRFESAVRRETQAFECLIGVAAKAVVTESARALRIIVQISRDANK